MKSRTFRPKGNAPKGAPRDSSRDSSHVSSRGKPRAAPRDGARDTRDKPRDKPYEVPREKLFDKPREGKRPFFDRADRGPSSRLTGPLLYGFHAVRAAVLNPERRVLRLLATDAAAEDLQKILDETKTKDIKRPNIEIIEKEAFDRMMPTGAVHQGIAATVESLNVIDAEELIGNLDRNEKSMLLILDQVTDPHNVGAILRSAAAFGAKGVIMQDRHAPEMTGVLAKVASGAADVIPVALETNLSRCIEMLQENGFFVIGLDERGEDIAKLPAYDRVALVLGAEGDGIRRLVAEHCDTLVSLPTSGEILSLNVSNAAAVALYAMRTK